MSPKLKLYLELEKALDEARRLGLEHAEDALGDALDFVWLSLPKRDHLWLNSDRQD
jgi:hypothetical protein